MAKKIMRLSCVGGLVLCAYFVCKKKQKQNQTVASAPVLTGMEAIIWGPDTPEKEKLLWDLSINIVTQNL